MSNENNAKYYYEKGMSDAHNDDYDPPYGGLPFDRGCTPDDKIIELNRAYDDGFYYVKGQLAGQKNSYRPPQNSDDKEAYDSGYEHGRENAPDEDDDDNTDDDDDEDDG